MARPLRLPVAGRTGGSDARLPDSGIRNIRKSSSSPKEFSSRATGAA